MEINKKLYCLVLNCALAGCRRRSGQDCGSQRRTGDEGRRTRRLDSGHSLTGPSSRNSSSKSEKSSSRSSRSPSMEHIKHGQNVAQELRVPVGAQGQGGGGAVSRLAQLG